MRDLNRDFSDATINYYYRCAKCRLVDVYSWKLDPGCEVVQASIPFGWKKVTGIGTEKFYCPAHEIVILVDGEPPAYGKAFSVDGEPA